MPVWKVISAECKDLISKMISPAEKRLTSQQVLNHPWIAKMADKKEVASVSTILTKNIRAFRTAQKVKKVVP